MRCAIIVSMQQKRAYRYRCYPTAEQATVLARTFGSARCVYNWARRLRTDASYQRQERIGYHEASAALTALTQPLETAWLTEVSSVPLQQALRHLDKGFRNFFAGRARYPAFHRSMVDRRRPMRVAHSAGIPLRVRSPWRKWMRRWLFTGRGSSAARPPPVP
jgi:transposase